MEQIIRFRHNVIHVSSINTFEGIKGGMNHGCKDVYFVRAIGVSSSYLAEIQKLDHSLINSMNRGRGYYHRLSFLPRMQSMEDTSFYSKCYEDWLDSGRKEIMTRATGKSRVLPGMLADACTSIEKLYKQENQQATNSMVKNFLVKILFWYDSVFTDEKFCYDEKKVMKIVAANVAKKQEYLFFYLVTLMGCDVLLLQSRADISEEEDKLALSEKFVLGNFSDIAIPDYQWYATVEEQPQKTVSAAGWTAGTQSASGAAAVSASENPNGRITVKIPQRNRSGSHQEPATQTTVPVAAGNHTGEKSFEELALLASSVVLITIFDGKGERMGTGSGIMIGKEGYILTNNHVASGGRCFSVRIEDDDQEYRTDEIIKYHSVLDLAIIRIQRKLIPLPVYKGSRPLVRGQKVVAIGSPLGLFNSVSDGIISGFRKIDDVDMIQFTAPTSRGSSGGAVLNMQGEVIGISTAGFDAGQNINLAMGYECVNLFIRGFL